MGSDRARPPGRRVRLETIHGPVEGRLHVSPILRTLDDLNMASRQLVVLHDAIADTLGWAIEDSPLALPREAILFGAEVDTFVREGAPPQHGGTMARAAVRLRVGAFTVRGFLHVPAGGDPLHRFNQRGHTFLALTAASVLGPATEFVAPFLAVNRRHVTAAQEAHASERQPEP